jgi:hypothetical protein
MIFEALCKICTNSIHACPHGVSNLFKERKKARIFELIKHSKQGLIEFRSRIGPHHDRFQLSLFAD